MKDEFVSVVSHELRTPLTSIRGALGLLAGGRVGELPDRASRMIDIAVSNTDRLVRLINDILDIERMESGRITLTRQFCDAGDLIDEAVEGMRPLASRAGIELEGLPCSTTIFADPDRIVQTITNLVSNAIKFSDPSTRILVTASLVNGTVQFEVQNEGRGIPASKLETIFERFQQVDASDSREKGGSGLGLAICRSVVRQHGGEIWCESEVGRGSRFLFTVPRANVVAAAAPAQLPARKTIAVCDDDPNIREMLSWLLDRNGYRVLAFASGVELVASQSVAEADAVLLDLMMPQMDGFEVLTALRARHDTADLPIVIVSGVLPADRSGRDVSGWVQKPCDDRTLLGALEKAIEGKGRRARVLLVEDDADLARIITESFRRLGIEIVHARTGEEAIELAQRHAPDLLVLDLVLPGVDGFGVVDWLKERALLPSVPLVVYSAVETTPAQRERLTLGPTEFLTKSRVSPDEFERRVVQLLGAVVTYPGEMSNVA
jgi:CheY-like chemotaxis protein